MTSASTFLPPAGQRRDLGALREASRRCRGGPLYEDATQTVFGAGCGHGSVVLVGEQPGDHEDREGEPFVGPAGKLLRSAMDDAGIDIGSVYVTNAVKHFKFERRGKVRIHKKPAAREVAACLPWLAAELHAVGPRVVVALGATAAQALVGPSVRVTRDRGMVLGGIEGSRVVPTVHPSSILRAPDAGARRAARAGLVTDLVSVKRLVT